MHVPAQGHRAPVNENLSAGGDALDVNVSSPARAGHFKRLSLRGSQLALPRAPPAAIQWWMRWRSLPPLLHVCAPPIALPSQLKWRRISRRLVGSRRVSS